MGAGEGRVLLGDGEIETFFSREESSANMALAGALGKACLERGA